MTPSEQAIPSPKVTGSETGVPLAQPSPAPDSPDNAQQLTSGRTLARSAFWNFLGQGLPLAVSVFAVRHLIHVLGTDRFGVLTLAWMAIGYLSFFDFGLGRALTKLVAEKLGQEREDEIPSIVWTAHLLILLLGIFSGILTALISPWLVYHALKIAPTLQRETLHAFYGLAVSLPAVLLTTGTRGVLEAQQRFKWINAVRIPMGIFTYAGPLLVLPFSHSMVPIVLMLGAGRLLTWLVYVALVFRSLPGLRKCVMIQREAIGPMLRFGGWMTVANVVGPIMINMDRFLIGAVLSLTAVTYYATSFEVVSELWIIPFALVGVLFPAFTTSFEQDVKRTVTLFDRGARLVQMALFPACLLVIAFAQDALRIWLGAEFAEHSYRVLQCMALGIFVNGAGQVASTVIQGVGRPDIPTKLSLIELPIYLVMLWTLLHAFGMIGAAVAWASRALLDTLLLLVMTRKILPDSGAAFRKAIGMVGLFGLGLLPAFITLPLSARIPLVFGLLVAFLSIGWMAVLNAAERLRILHYLGRLRA